MKYLKKFEELDMDRLNKFIQKHSEIERNLKRLDEMKIKYIKSIINHDLVSDLKELCMDYLDNDDTLYIGIWDLKMSIDQLIGSIEINHERLEYKWFDLLSFNIPLGEKEEKIHYTFNVARISTKKIANTDDILKTIKTMYPGLI